MSATWKKLSRKVDAALRGRLGCAQARCTERAAWCEDLGGGKSRYWCARHGADRGCPLTLTPAQLRALQRLASASGDVHFERKPERAPACVLFQLGLARHLGFCRLGFLARITTAGREALVRCVNCSRFRFEHDAHKPHEVCRGFVALSGHVSATAGALIAASDCTCHKDCREDSASGTWHQHEGEPCPVHPETPVR